MSYSDLQKEIEQSKKDLDQYQSKLNKIIELMVLLREFDILQVNFLKDRVSNLEKNIDKKLIKQQQSACCILL